MKIRSIKIDVWRKYLPVVAPGFFVLGLLTFLVLLQSSQIWKLFSVDTASDTLTLYALTSLNFFALVIFAFIFFRSVLKLVRERRSSRLGSKLKTRLLIYFVAISLLPIAAMATFSYLFLNRALEKWFSRLPETVIAEARGVQQRSIDKQIQNFYEKAQIIGVLIESQPNIDETQLRNVIERAELSAVEITTSNKTILARTSSEMPSEQDREMREILQTDLTSSSNLQIWRDGIGFDAIDITLSDGRIARVVSNWQGEGNQSEKISNSPIEFERLKDQQAEVRQLGFSTLSLLTFLLVFAASWVAFHLGRSLTQPIRALAEASHEIAEGNLKHRINILAEDELALLIDSFNQMTAQLAENQHKLEERRNYIETVLQSLSTGVVSFDESNRVTTINQAAIKMLRLEKIGNEEILLAEIVAQDDLQSLEKLMLRARRLGNATEQTVLMQNNQNGNGNGAHIDDAKQSLPVALTSTALRGVDGKNLGVVLVIEDLSELLTAQRAAAWQEVARRMAHEIKNPLTPIQLSAERIAKRFVQSHEQTIVSEQHSGLEKTTSKEQIAKVITDGTNTILREVSSLKAMVDEFSQYARLPHAKLEINNLNEIVRQAIDLYEDRFDAVKLNINLTENLPATMLDIEQMRRIFVNLIDNAIEATIDQPTEKQITIKTWFSAEKESVFAEVSDTGRGIVATDFPKLFQPYFSTKNRGTGLGLAIVQRIIKEHGGRIRAAANYPTGAKFVIELPILN